MSAAVHFNIPNYVEVEPMTPPTKDLEVDPIFSDTTTMGIADTLLFCHSGDNWVLESIPCTSDTKDEPIILPSSFLSMKGERIP